MKAKIQFKHSKYIYGAGLIFLIFSGIFVNSQLMHVGLMEARNFVTAREMVQDNHWLIPTMNGEIRIAKPPLPTWATALAMMAVKSDTNLTANRFPAGLAALFLIFSFYSFAKAVTKDRETASYAAIALSTSYMFMYMARKGTWDIFCHSFMVGAIWMLHKGFTSENGKYCCFAASGVLMGLSWMSKGPVAFYALLLPFIISMTVTYGKNIYKNNSRPLLIMIIVSLSIVLPWFIYLYLHAPDLSHHVAGKETNAWFNKHIQPIWYYLKFPAMSGIWVFMFTPLLWVPYARKRIRDIKNYKMLFLWTVVMIILLSIIPEKKDRYLLPATIPMSFLIGYYLKYLSTMSGYRDKIQVCIYLSLSTIIATATALSAVYYMISSEFHTYMIAVLVTDISLIYILIRSFINHSWKTYIYSISLIFALSLYSIPPLASKFMKENSPVKLLDLRNYEALKQKKLYAFNDNLKTVWAAGVKITKITKGDLAAIDSEALLLANDRENEELVSKVMESCSLKEQYQITDNTGRTLWHLFSINDKQNQNQEAELLSKR
ncbi:4-amino-4-deoxy-L-arabinose transferase-like glycosyltransferase of PMT family [Denitrovibrio acetiphilus DSM 12809]|uniref:4-amino-4-deoxy-L-arabinose transferase-like glycosyltransferase of PMT family n=1 Tax=Denitrovibrio acetiphilus (strain DSM 12809 / NBRC 114555 / N2460) TaxID=522772 RepID=D4H6X2_DENA2|nr:glycosyltransferase family 39 protein [Denitrovibrio acetiphilus]ADD67838.1 4-amino-4-deoxy-L-arabinose transferase-like glycosyltransferase of PMT family [Denitrovibrio acetiphilus DSM 12809]